MMKKNFFLVDSMPRFKKKNKRKKKETSMSCEACCIFYFRCIQSLSVKRLNLFFLGIGSFYTVYEHLDTFQKH